MLYISDRCVKQMYGHRESLLMRLWKMTWTGGGEESVSMICYLGPTSQITISTQEQTIFVRLSFFNVFVVSKGNVFRFYLTSLQLVLSGDLHCRSLLVLRHSTVFIFIFIGIIKLISCKIEFRLNRF